MDLPRTRRDLLKRYGLALALAGLALLVRAMLPVPEGTTIYQLPLAAVVLSGWYGGRGPGLLASLICATGVLYWFIPPVYSFDLSPGYGLPFCIFIALCLLLSEFGGRRRGTERALRESEARFRTFVDHATDAFFLLDEQVIVVDANRQARAGLGYSREELIGMHPRDFDVGLDEQSIAQLGARVGAGETVTFETVHRRKDGGVFPVEIRARAFQQGEQQFILSLVRDISERKRSEAERQAHVWFLESMDRINRAMQGTNDVERMMSDVLDAVLERLACDRAWLLYPCDPDAPSWRAVMEHTRPEYPGAFALGVALAADADTAAIFAAARASPGPVFLGAAYELRIPEHVAERFTIRSAMAMALCPKGDRPYLFGVHQCSHPRMWTNDEQRLFEEIGHRLTDALTSLVSFRGLRESEARLEAAQRVAHVGWWERDYATGHVSLSDEACRIFGVQPIELPQWHERWLSLIHPDDRHKAAEASEKAMGGEARYDVEYRVIRPDGVVRMVHSQGDVTRDASGRAVRQFGVLQDITELRYTERKLEAAQRLARVGWWERDFVRGRWLTSDEIARIYGIAEMDRDMDLAEWMNVVPSIIHPEDLRRVLEASEATLRGGPRYDIEYRIVHAEGTVRVVHVQADVTLDEAGRPVRQFGVAQDITELRQAEQELRTSEERFRTLVQFSFDVYWETDAQHRFTRQEFIEGLADAPERESEIGKTRWEVPYLEPDEEAWRRHRATLDAHLPFRDFEIARRAPGGGKRYVSTSGLPMFDETGRFLGYRGVGRHITERKRAEQELQRLHLQLVHMSRVMTTAELATSIAHEVNQPLGSILASVGPCLRWLNAQPPDLASARIALERIATEAERASQVISRIRALVRREPPRHERINVNQMISEVIALTRDQMHSHDVSLQSELAADLIVVHGDRVQLQQVLLNLIVNAIEAMGTIRDGRRQLAILSANDDSGVRVEVRDCGPGVDPDGGERIFEPFYTTKPDGIGMGLWICRSIIEAHGGRLWVTPNAPRGAAFQFSLPPKKQKAEWAAGRDRNRQNSSAERRVDQ